MWFDNGASERLIDQSKELAALQSDLALARSLLVEKDTALAQALGAKEILQLQITDLKAHLGQEQAERRALLDRLLERHNVTPVNEPAKTVQVTEMVNPTPPIPPELADAWRASWEAEEAGHIAAHEGLDPMRAADEARRRFHEQYTAIK